MTGSAVTELGIFVQLVVSGLAVGAIYALVALGFVLIFKATGVLNFAQGDLMMVGVYVCYLLVVTLGIPFLPALGAALAAAAALGCLVNVTLLRPMVGQPIFSVVMLTIGLSSVLRSLVGLAAGHQERRFPSPVADAPVALGPAVISRLGLWTLGAALLCLAGFLLFFRYTRVGLGMRATAQDQDAAALMGIGVGRVFALSWAVSAAVATVAGVFLAGITFVHPDMGFVGIRVFPALILGGLDSVAGAIVGGLLVGVIENLAGGYLDRLVGGGVKELTAFTVILAVLMLRPYGLFGTRDVERV
jgi:branched-chain amino acid transport system permease protein